jgi:aminopeptidase-like protein
VLLNAHNCHPHQANDDVSGVAVGIEVMQRLAVLPKRWYSYRLLVAPELIGPIFWLDDLGDDASDIAYAILLKSVGNDAPLRLQDSFRGDSPLDAVAHHVFGQQYGSCDSGAYREVYGNDETVFEAPGYEIPTISVTRYPFPSYHTDKDTPETLSEARLQDTVETVSEICLGLERNICLERRFKRFGSLVAPAL